MVVYVKLTITTDDGKLVSKARARCQSTQWSITESCIASAIGDATRWSDLSEEQVVRSMAKLKGLHVS